MEQEMRTSRIILLTLLIVILPYSAFAQTADTNFKAGAAKVDVTPPESGFTTNIEGILDRLYSRAIVVDNGVTSAALITVDTGVIPEPVWKNLTQRIEKSSGFQLRTYCLLRPTPTVDP